jgi:hypothetical protein
MTGGRTRSRRPGLEIEALVSTTRLGEASAPKLRTEWRTIAGMCRSVLSIAEISAKLDAPLAVVAILVGDMADQGLVIVHRPATMDGPDVTLLERVLHGLREI